MGIKITIPNTSSDVLTFGSGNTPTAAQIAGIDSGSSNGQLALYTTASGTSTERVRVDASGNVGIGTTSPSTYGAKLVVAAQNGIAVVGYQPLQSWIDTNDANKGVRISTAGGVMGFQNDNTGGGTYTERMRIDSSGNLLVGTTATFDSARVHVLATSSASCITTKPASNVTYDGMTFRNFAGTYVGYINVTASATSYVTSSDYRLKENIAPMTGALAKVAQLKPVTYNWKSDGSASQGFIAHELQAIVPDCVVGEKDAVETYTDEDGNEQTRPVYQGIDTSFLVATLTAAIQEQQAIIQTLTDRITALENK